MTSERFRRSPTNKFYARIRPSPRVILRNEVGATFGDGASDGVVSLAEELNVVRMPAGLMTDRTSCRHDLIEDPFSPNVYHEVVVETFAGLCQEACRLGGTTKI